MGSRKKIEKYLSVFAGFVPYLHVTAKAEKGKANMNKKLILVFGAILAAGTLMARPGFGGPRGGFGGPRGGFGHHGGFGRGPAPMMHHRPAPMHHHHHGGWGHGGRGFWPGFVGGVVGGVLTDAIIGPRVITTPIVTTPVVTTPVVTTPVVTTPVYTTEQIWVPGTYVDQIQSNGTVVRVWQPGHYESRQILVQ